MPWYFYLVHFLAGAFFANGVPHFVQGICGNTFQTPFASPRGIGESSAVVNVVWGFFNFIVGAALMRIFFVGPPRPVGIAVAVGLGVFVMALALAYHFGKVRKTAPHP
jgi:hypothetical protein